MIPGLIDNLEFSAIGKELFLMKLGLIWTAVREAQREDAKQWQT